VRLRIGETREFQAAIEHEAPPPVPLARLLANHLGAVLAGSAGVIACFAIFYLATAYALAQGTGTLGYPRETFLAVQLAANCFLAVGIVLAAIQSDRASPRSVLMIGALATVVLGLVFGAGLGSGSLWLVFATLAAALLVMGYVYGPLGAWLPTLFPVPVRYSGISVAFNAGGIVGGAVTPVLAQILAVEGRGGQAGLLLSVAGVVTLLGVSLARPPLTHSGRETA
jgi:MFS family permease